MSLFELSSQALLMQYEGRRVIAAALAGSVRRLAHRVATLFGATKG